MDDITRVEVERYPTRESAIQAEIRAIRSERPLYNIAHAKSGKQFDEVEDLPTLEIRLNAIEQKLDRLLGCEQAAPSREFYNVVELAKITGISASQLNKLRLYQPDRSPPFNYVGRRVVYPREALHAWMSQRQAN